jgi:hypothetical protein
MTAPKASQVEALKQRMLMDSLNRAIGADVPPRPERVITLLLLGYIQVICRLPQEARIEPLKLLQQALDCLPLSASALLADYLLRQVPGYRSPQEEDEPT